MPGPTPQERYHLVAPLPPLGGWRRMLALDRRGSQSGPVVLSFAPPALVEDPARLAALSRDAEAGARVHHPNVLPVLGLEAVDDQLALVEPYRAGPPLRALLDASGRLPVELAVRVACDVAAGLAALHALDVGDGQPLAHGALTPERIQVAEDGTALVSGVGTGGGRVPADDIRALALVVAEMLTGELPRGTSPLEAPGVPPVVAAVIDRARGLGGASIEGAAAFAAALAASHAPAAIAALSVYVGSATPPPPDVPVIPAAGAPRAPVIPALTPPLAPAPALEAPEVSAELIAPGAPAEVSAELIAPGRLGTAGAPEPSGERRAPPDAAITFPAPFRAAAARRLPRASVLVAVVAVGLALGFGIARLAFAPATPPPASPPAEPAAAAVAPMPTQPDPPPMAEVPARPPEVQPAEAAPMQPPVATRARPADPPRRSPSISVTAVPAGEILVDGKPAGRAPIVLEVSAGEHEVRLRDRAQGVDARKRVVVKAPATPVRFQLTRGRLEVTAPGDTEIWVDGRRVGKGDQSIDLWEGAHEVEARRGAAKVKERFELTPLVTRWTFNVTPTP